MEGFIELSVNRLLIHCIMGSVRVNCFVLLDIHHTGFLGNNVQSLFVVVSLHPFLVLKELIDSRIEVLFPLHLLDATIHKSSTNFFFVSLLRSKHKIHQPQPCKFYIHPLSSAFIKPTLPLWIPELTKKLSLSKLQLHH